MFASPTWPNARVAPWWCLAAAVVLFSADMMGSAVAAQVSFGLAIVPLARAAQWLVRQNVKVRSPWWWLWGSFVLAWVGTGVRTVAEAHSNPDVPYAADILDVVVTIGILVAIHGLQRTYIPHHSLPAALDALIFAGAATLLVVSFAAPAEIHDVEPLSLFFIVTFVVLDALLAVMAGQLWFNARHDNRCVWYITAMVAVMIAFNTAHARGHALGNFDSSLSLHVWLACGALIALAATDGSIIRPHLASDPDQSIRAGALVLCLVIPWLVIASHDASTSRAQWVAVGVTALGLNALIMSRLYLLVNELRVRHDELQVLAQRDTLTGVYNRRYFEQTLATRADVASKRGRWVAVIDLDHFKRWNDLHGHLEGDRILRACAQAWSRAIGDAGLLARYGGEEFVVAIWSASHGNAVALLNHMRACTPQGVTCSVGLAAWPVGVPAEESLRRADEALYAAKDRGRDTLVVAEADRTLDVRSLTSRFVSPQHMRPQRTPSG